MINSSLKRAVAVAILAGASVGANAATDLGTLPATPPTGFAGTVLGGGTSFSEIFTFTLSEPNIGSSYLVQNVPTTVSPAVTFDGILSAISLFSAGANGVVGGGDDTLLASSVNPGGDSLSLDYGQSLSGASYITVSGISNGSAGAIFAGQVATVVPEPETYAMLLAGLGLMGAVVRRRGTSKTS
ncbi:FxDxF family PEP-CTERM protein [Nitrosospira sp. NpAV]|uniref:FxDxF family PEP-CTERM protein n=1 Tax=Nitrosospira sp. NpAV TaxID=58133 RepID=UPI00059F4F8A|nr:FxDxF family PEP-CTERM protein [Nitrosospira sp. NpAV]KIO49439.1 hypothetical protein SQ11_07125 [Nitrosospira sp. NpAV]